MDVRVGGDFSVFEADDAGGVGAGEVGIVRDHNHELGLGDFLENLHDLLAGLGVESAGGLVGQENVWVVDEGAGDGDALHLAAGKFGRAFHHMVAETDSLQSGASADSSLFFGDAGQRQGETNVV